MKRFLAMTAVLFLLLRPLCDAWGATHNHAVPGASAAVALADGHSAGKDSDEFCCTKIQDSNLIVPAAVALAGTASDAWSLAPAAGFRVGRAQQRQVHVRHLPGAPPLRLSYYARSARILR